MKEIITCLIRSNGFPIGRGFDVMCNADDRFEVVGGGCTIAVCGSRNRSVTDNRRKEPLQLFRSNELKIDVQD